MAGIMRSFFSGLKNQIQYQLTTHERNLSVWVMPGLITAIVMVIEAMGGLELLELQILDGLMRSRLDRGMDDRILVVGITESDLETYSWPVPDQILANALERLQKAGAKAIGLDLYRNFSHPPGLDALNDRLAVGNVVGILQLGKITGEWIAPPPVLLADQVGFNDLLLDVDSVVRRNALFAQDEETDYQSLAFRLARLYLQDQGIYPQLSEEDPNKVLWGATTLHPLEFQSGGYAHLDAQGYQILADYQTLGAISPIVSLEDVLTGKVDRSLIHDRIVLIGTLAPSLKDLFFTPYSVADPKNSSGLSGVLIHAHFTRQLIDLALGEQPLFRFCPRAIEIVWILIWATIGVLILDQFRHPLWVAVASVGSGIVLWGSQRILFSYHIWIPIVAPGIGFGLGLGSLLVYSRYQMWQSQQILLKQTQEQSAAIAQLQTLIQASSLNFRAASGLSLELPETTLPNLETEPFTASIPFELEPLAVSPTPKRTTYALTSGGSLGGRYRIQKVLGEGGFAITYLAQDIQRPGTPTCVIKRFYPTQRNPNFLKAAQRLFESEAQILEQLGRHHDRIPQLLAHFEENQEFYLVQDYVQGHPFSLELRSHISFSVQAVVDLLLDILPTLRFIHRHQVIHRDLKPSNLIRRVDQSMVIIDFGAVKYLSPPNIDGGSEEQKTIAVGTPGYSPLEQMAGYPRLNSDLYALGMIGIQCLTTTPPQDLEVNVETGEPIWKPIVDQQHPNDPFMPPLIEILSQLVQFNACDRYQSADEAIKDLKKLKIMMKNG
ncbi:MAG: CHASE2 domain-containing protein [Prochlorotrichaceae cyanobacterium]